jgi:hypothetical protein
MFDVRLRFERLVPVSKPRHQRSSSGDPNLKERGFGCRE